MRPVRVPVIACLGVLLGGVLFGGLVTGSPASAAGDHRVPSGHPGDDNRAHVHNVGAG